MSRNNETAEKKAAFLNELRARGTVYHAARAAGIGRQTAYRWREASAGFAADWDDALEDTTEILEDSMYQRALNGDTTAGIFLLKARRPNVYRERVQMQHADAEGKRLPLGAVEEFVKDALGNRA